MTKSTKAALLSALVFPGAGHLFLKKYVSAVVLASTAFIGVYYLTMTMVERALQITQKIQTGEIPLDVIGITELVSKQSSGDETQLINIATTAFVIVWLIGIIDSYRIGRKNN